MFNSHDDHLEGGANMYSQMLDAVIAYGGGFKQFAIKTETAGLLEQCFSNAGPRPGTGPWHQLYRAVRYSPGIDK